MTPSSATLTSITSLWPRAWVEILHERLKIRLGQLLGEEASIWRDRKLQGNDVFADALAGKIANVAILVSALSPRYVKSE